MTEPLATLSASFPRRLFGVGTLLCLGGALIYIALAQPPALGWQLFLLVMGGAALWLADRMRRATQTGLVLTEEGLFDSTGRSLAPLDEITGIERGMFAMKPSNGFTLRLKTSQPAGWAPGLWWRFGRRLGVGGVTSAPQAKTLAEILTAMIAERGGVTR